MRASLCPRIARERIGEVWIHCPVSYYIWSGEFYLRARSLLFFSDKRPGFYTSVSLSIYIVSRQPCVILGIYK